MQFQRYRIKAGDTLVTIAQEKYGDPRLYSEIAKQNGIRNPDLIYEGQIIRLPNGLAGNPAGGKNGSAKPRSAAPRASGPSGDANGKATSGKAASPKKTGSSQKTRGDGKSAKVSQSLRNKVDHAKDEQIYAWLFNGRLSVGKSTRDNKKGLPRLPAAEFKEFMKAVEQEAYNRDFPKRVPKMYDAATNSGPAGGTEPVDASGKQLTRKKLSEIADPYRAKQK